MGRAQYTAPGGLTMFVTNLKKEAQLWKPFSVEINNPGSKCPVCREFFPPTGVKTGNSEETSMCCVCFERPQKRARIERCGHEEFCDECMSDLVRRSKKVK